MKKTVTGIMITLLTQPDEKQLLFILLRPDGGIHRMGVGNHSPDDLDQSMFIGKISSTVFRQVLGLVTKDIKQGMGRRFKAPVIKGERLSLEILLEDNTGESEGIGFEYGMDSMGPPPPVCNLVVTAVRLTDQWYAAQKQMVRKLE